MGGGLPGEGFGEDFFGQDVAEVEEEVFEVRQGSTPGGALGAVELVHQVVGDAFEIGADFFYLGTPLLRTRHHNSLSRLAADGRTDFLRPS
jgi:hypothetical protein